MKVATIISSAIDKGILIVKILCMGKSDIQTVKNCSPYGIDSNPVKGLKAIMEVLNMSDKVLLGIVNKDSKALPGETRVYSSDFEVWLRNGKIEIGGNVNWAVKYTELAAEFNKLKDSVNNLTSAFNSHAHATAAVGSPSPPIAVPNIIPATPNGSDITSAKNENILTI